MSSQTPQDFSNHSRLLTGYHYVLAALVFANAIYAIYTLVTAFSAAFVFATITAIALIMTAFYARGFALKAQDRIIRLEERLRLSRILPDDLKSKVESLTTDQLIALRFASDGELAELTRKVILEEIADQKEIKKLIKNWRPDYQRV